METPDRLPVLSAEIDDDELMALAVADPQDEGYQPWQIDTVRMAEWAMRKVSQAEAEIFDAKQHAEYWHHEIDEWLIKATSRAQTTSRFLGHHLEEFALAVRITSDHKLKTVELPAGVVNTRADKAKVVVVDETKLIEWCEVNLNAAVKIDKSILVSELRKHVEIASDGMSDPVVVDPVTGELVPGVDVMPERVTAKVVTR